MSSDEQVDEVQKYIDLVANGDAELAKYLCLLIGATIEKPTHQIHLKFEGHTPLKPSDSLMADVWEKYG